jgi:hypothetical protein
MKKDNKNVKIYRRLLKYSPFVPRRKDGVMKIIHNLKGNRRIEAIAPEFVSVSDAEKLYVAIYIANKTQNISIDGSQALFSVYIKDIKKACNINNENYIFEALKRITQITITYYFTKTKRVFHIIDAVDFNSNTGVVKIKMPSETFKAFLEKAAHINIEKYIELKPVAKNLYGYISSNSSNMFRENLLIERTASGATRKDKAQSIIRESFAELKNSHIINDFKIVKKGGQRYINIKKIGGNKSTTTGVKHSPLQV